MSWQDSTLAVYVPANAAQSFAAYHADLEALASRAAGTPTRLRVDAPTVTLEDAPSAQQRAANHPLVKQAMELLNAKIVGVQPRAQRPQT